MNIRGLFRSASAWTAEEVRDYLQRHHPEDYYLIDVSRPKEYAAGHLPGARSIPLEDLEEVLPELDPGCPVIVYGGAGLRSLAATALFVQGGFPQVHRMVGGLSAWHGEVAEGSPEEDLDFFSRGHSAEEHAALAWLLEEGTRVFYAQVSRMVKDREAASLFRELITAEEHHKATLTALYEGLTGKPLPPRFPEGVIPEGGGGLMEGGMAVDDALELIQGRQVRDILELAVHLETNAYDRYLLLRLELPDENSRRVFEVLSDEEKRHLRKLDELLRHFV